MDPCGFSLAFSFTEDDQPVRAMTPNHQGYPYSENDNLHLRPLVQVSTTPLPVGWFQHSRASESYGNQGNEEVLHEAHQLVSALS